MSTALFTTTEAQALTGSSAKSIQKLIEKQFICFRLVERGARARRMLEPADLLTVLIVDQCGELLTGHARKLVHERLHEEQELERLEKVEVGGGLVLHVASQRRRVVEAMEKLEKAKETVVEDPHVKGGEPVIRGTRIPARQVAVMANTMTPQEILEGYPTLDQERIELARVWAEACPKQGRPARTEA